MGKKKVGSLSFADLTGGRKRVDLSRKKMKKAAKFHLKEMKIKRKKFKKVAADNGTSGSKKALRKYRREHADELAEILLGGRLKNPDKYEYKLQEYIEEGKLFDPAKKGQVKKVAKKNPSLMAYAHIVAPIDPDIVRSTMRKRVRRLTNIVDDKSAAEIAPLAKKSDAAKVLRVMMRIATKKDTADFDAKDFFRAVRPKGIDKKEWNETIVNTVLGSRGHTNTAIKDMINYAINLLGDMSRDRIRKILRRYADSITAVQESGEKLNFMVTLKDLSNDPKIEKVLNNNPKIANVIGQL